MALFRLSSVPVDRAVPSEALRTNVAWVRGLPVDALLLSTRQLDAFRRGEAVQDETATRGVPMALATDCNPGSAPVESLLLMLNMGCTLFGLTPEEALRGVTSHAARALGMAGQLGTLEVGKAADLALWSIDQPAELAYRIGKNALIEVVSGGSRAR